MEITTKSAQETQNLGASIGHSLIKNARLRQDFGGQSRGNTATILTLSGELGSGKTTFTQGLALGLGIKNRILSPTFILSREYPLNNILFIKLIHIDLYRGEKLEDFASLGLDEIFANPANLVVIEWPERLRELPRNAIKIKF